MTASVSTSAVLGPRPATRTAGSSVAGATFRSVPSAPPTPAAAPPIATSVTLSATSVPTFPTHMA